MPSLRLRRVLVGALMFGALAACAELAGLSDVPTVGGDTSSDAGASDADCPSLAIPPSCMDAAVPDGWTLAAFWENYPVVLDDGGYALRYAYAPRTTDCCSKCAPAGGACVATIEYGVTTACEVGSFVLDAASKCVAASGDHVSGTTAAVDGSVTCTAAPQPVAAVIGALKSSCGADICAANGDKICIYQEGSASCPDASAWTVGYTRDESPGDWDISCACGCVADPPKCTGKLMTFAALGCSGSGTTKLLNGTCTAPLSGAFKSILYEGGVSSTSCTAYLVDASTTYKQPLTICCTN
jgi:hypothetical protein